MSNDPPMAETPPRMMELANACINEFGFAMTIGTIAGILHSTGEDAIEIEAKVGPEDRREAQLAFGQLCHNGRDALAASLEIMEYLDSLTRRADGTIANRVKNTG